MDETLKAEKCYQINVTVMENLHRSSIYRWKQTLKFRERAQCTLKTLVTKVFHDGFGDIIIFHIMSLSWGAGVDH